ncbi:MAG: efflux RND transporter periplasmic adaptor subunit [Muribaculaceae bacterium]|nr:efflux RND transporter periplasmic adaptor subunit [Muribaculaceae bacterium]
MIKYNITILSVAALFASAGLLSCSSDKKGGEQKDEKPVVKVETVSQRLVDQLATYTATVEADIVNNISSSTPNRIKQITVDEGMLVSAGQVLVVLDDVNAVNYQTQVENAKANLRNVQTNYDRALELFKIGGGTKQNVDQMETQLINAKNSLAAAERTLRNSKENTVLTAPISGVVTARNYDPGDMTSNLPILTIAKVNPVKIVTNIPESELSKVNKGMPAEIHFDTYGDTSFAGIITMIAPTVNAQSRTFGVEITMPNSDSRVLPGMFGRVTLNLGQSEHVVVPDKAVIKMPGAGAHYVYTYADGKVKYNKVELGQRLGDSYEILSGIENGASVVISGQSKLSNGAEVTLVK